MTVALPPLQQERPQVPRAAIRPTPFATPILDVRRYSFWYGNTQALFDLNLTVPRQAVTALIGPSGCGKSKIGRAELQSQSNLVCRLLLEKKKTPEAMRRSGFRLL